MQFFYLFSLVVAASYAVALPQPDFLKLALPSPTLSIVEARFIELTLLSEKGLLNGSLGPDVDGRNESDPLSSPDDPSESSRRFSDTKVADSCKSLIRVGRI
ncbi:hypothetical protein BASA60_007326 [Batrachochytrium salamandrivorans]|nr:hypothetical protein BASA60_007326 [Batrachochytrium salamandrivorans]